MRMSTGSQLVSATPSPWWLAVLVVRRWLSVARQDAECDELSQPHLAPAPPPPLPGQGAGPTPSPGGSDQGLLLRPRSVKLSEEDSQTELYRLRPSVRQQTEAGDHQTEGGAGSQPADQHGAHPCWETPGSGPVTVTPPGGGIWGKTLTLLSSLAQLDSLIARHFNTELSRR